MSELDPLTTLAANASLGDYKHVVVNMFGVDGNAFSIIGAAQMEMKRAGVPPEVIKVFFDEATSGDYEHLIATVKANVTVVNIRPRDRATSAATAFDLHADGCDMSDDY